MTLSIWQINAGAIGDVRTIHITSRDPAPPPVAYLQTSGGMFMDMTSHDFDMARFLVSNSTALIFIDKYYSVGDGREMLLVVAGLMDV